MTDAFLDPFESGMGGAPAVSWKKADEGTVFEGVILPFDLAEPNRGYGSAQRTDIQTGDPLFWDAQAARKISNRTSDDTGRPNRPVVDPILLVQTDYRNSEFISKEQKERMATDEREDDGLRRYYAAGATAGKALKDALAKARVQKPEVGGKIVVTLAKQTPNNYGGETNNFETVYTRPDAATKKIVDQYVADNAEPDADDPFAAPAAQKNDEPPF